MVTKTGRQTNLALWLMEQSALNVMINSFLVSSHPSIRPTVAIRHYNGRPVCAPLSANNVEPYVTVRKLAYWSLCCGIHKHTGSILQSEGLATLQQVAGHFPATTPGEQTHTYEREMGETREKCINFYS